MSAVANQRRLRRALLATVVVVSLAVGVAFASSEWPFAQGLAMARVSGWVAVVGLALSLSVTPLSRVSALRGLSTWRRAAGVSTAVAASVHVILSLIGPLDGAWRAILSWPYLSAGALAFVVFVLLAITSFPGNVRLLRLRHWKVLHRAAYAAAAFTGAHLMLSPWGSVSLKTLATVALGTLLFSRILIRFAPSYPPSRGSNRHAPGPRD